MSIKEILKEHFDSYDPLRKRPADNGVTKEVPWREDSDNHTTGVIVEDKSDGGF
jgi:hypothetical protein